VYRAPGILRVVFCSAPISDPTWAVRAKPATDSGVKPATFSEISGMGGRFVGNGGGFIVNRQSTADSGAGQFPARLPPKIHSEREEESVANRSEEHTRSRKVLRLSWQCR